MHSNLYCDEVNTKLKDLEAMVDEPTTSCKPCPAHGSKARQHLDPETLFTLIDDETEANILNKEQDVLDKHDDDMTNLAMRIKQFEA